MKKLLLSSFIGLTLLSNPIFAQDSDLVMLHKIQKEYPNLNVIKTTYLPSVKLYEVRTKSSKVLSFTNNDLDYFILNGQIIDPKSKHNISIDRDMVQVQDFFNNLPFDKSIHIKYGNGSRKIAVFTDPDCPYCKATDQDIDNQMQKDNITFNYFMNPLNIEGHDESPLKARKIWCSADRAQAWKEWMVNGILPNNPGTCKTPVAETKQFSSDNGFNSTPTLIFDNGFVWRGKITPAQIREILNKKQP
jgi:thiol:disulfide interchange protein DsbC